MLKRALYLVLSIYSPQLKFELLVNAVLSQGIKLRTYLQSLGQQLGASMSQKGLTDELLSNSSNMNAVSTVKKLLFRRMLVGVNDGRFFMGNFHCMDKQGNIILQDALEFRSLRRSSPSPMEQRGLGLILIPSSCRTSCHIDCSVDEQLSLLSLNQG
ncbi:unnamed protein product [Amaranthus hypochondriacus]